MQTGTTKQAFVDALCQLACKRPIAKVTVKEIADKAGYNRSTFYQYFQDVYDLLDYLASLAVQRIKANVIENIQAQHVGEAFVQAFTQMHHDEAKYFDILFLYASIHSAKPCFEPVLFMKIDNGYLKVFIS